MLVILNFTGRNKTLALPVHARGKVLVSTHRSPEEFSYFQNIQITPYEATIWLMRELKWRGPLRGDDLAEERMKGARPLSPVISECEN